MREGSTLKLQNAGQGTTTWSLEANRIYGCDNFGVEVLAGGGAMASPGPMNATIGKKRDQGAGNDGGHRRPSRSRGVHVNIGTVSGETFQACADIRDNDLASSGADATRRRRSRLGAARSRPRVFSRYPPRIMPR